MVGFLYFMPEPSINAFTETQLRKSQISTVPAVSTVPAMTIRPADKQRVTVLFDSKGGQINIASELQVPIGTWIPLPSVEKHNITSDGRVYSFKFKYWLTEEGLHKKANELYQCKKANDTLVAVYDVKVSAIEHSINFKGVATRYVSENSEIGELPIITRKDSDYTGNYVYYSKGWYYLKDSNKIEIKSSTKMPNHDLEVLPVWSDRYDKFEPNEFSILFDSNGGTHCTGIKVKYGSYLRDLPEPEKTGYVFDYWENSDGPVTGNRTLKAHFTPIKYQLVLMQDSTKVLQSKVLFYDESTELPNLEDTETSLFRGWTLNNGASTPDYLAKNSVSKLTSSNGCTVVLYPVFDKIATPRPTGSVSVILATTRPSTTIKPTSSSTAKPTVAPTITPKPTAKPTVKTFKIGKGEKIYVKIGNKLNPVRDNAKISCYYDDNRLIVKGLKCGTTNVSVKNVVYRFIVLKAPKKFSSSGFTIKKGRSKKISVKFAKGYYSASRTFKILKNKNIISITSNCVVKGKKIGVATVQIGVFNGLSKKIKIKVRR